MINIQNINLTFKEKQIFENFSLSVKNGDKLLITGKSGLGKTTLFNLIMGFVSEYKGSISIDSNEITPASIWELRNKIAFVPQNPDIGDGLVSDFFKYIYTLKAQSKLKYNLTIIKQWLLFFDLEETILSMHIEKLSGGEKQRIAIIAALLTERTIFLLDEPTSSLHPLLKQKVVSLFSSNPQWTVLVISHDSEWSECINFTNLNFEGVYHE